MGKGVLYSFLNTQSYFLRLQLLLDFKFNLSSVSLSLDFSVTTWLSKELLSSEAKDEDPTEFDHMLDMLVHRVLKLLLMYNNHVSAAQ